MVIGYQVSWPDELIVWCTIATLAETTKEHKLWKHTLFLVGVEQGEEMLPVIANPRLDGAHEAQELAALLRPANRAGEGVDAAGGRQGRADGAGLDGDPGALGDSLVEVRGLGASAVLVERLRVEEQRIGAAAPDRAERRPVGPHQIQVVGRATGERGRRDLRRHSLADRTREGEGRVLARLGDVDVDASAVERDRAQLVGRVVRVQLRGTGGGSLRVDTDRPGAGLVERLRVEERGVGAARERHEPGPRRQHQR